MQREALHLHRPQRHVASSHPPQESNPRVRINYPPSRLQSVGGLSEGWERESTPIPQAAEQNVASRGRRYTIREAINMNIALEDTEKAINPLATASTQCGSQQSPIRGSYAATHPSLFSFVKSCSAPLYFPWYFAVLHF